MQLSFAAFAGLCRRPLSRRIIVSSFAAMLCAFAGAQRPTTAPPSAPAHTDAAFAKLPLSFEPNRGQSDPAVQWIANSPQATVFLTGADAVLRTSSFTKDTDGGKHPAQTRVSAVEAVRMHLAGAVDKPVATHGGALPGTINYMSGNDRSQWHTSVPTYDSVRLAGVYPGVDLRYYGHTGQLEYDFIVAPNANPAAIKLQFAGSAAKLGTDGDLVLPMTVGKDLHFDKPVAYQMIDGERVSVEASFQLSARRDVTFQLGAYDHDHELVIDPTLVYLGELGTGNGDNVTQQIVADSSGALYFTGYTNSSGFPTVNGYQSTYISGYAAYVTKLSADGTALVYSTFLESGGSDGAVSLALDGSGDAYVLGNTNSQNFPITANAFQSVEAPYTSTGYSSGNESWFFTELNPQGDGLLYSSFLGGSNNAYPALTALDAAGDWYMYGSVQYVYDLSDLYYNPGNGQHSSGNYWQFPTTSGGYQTIAPGNDLNNVPVLVEFSPTSSGFQEKYGTFYGDFTNNVQVYAQSMTVGADGYVFLGGYTAASALPTTAGTLKTACTAVQSNPAYCTTYDGFIAAINTEALGTASLAYATRLAGTSTNNRGTDETVYGLVADAANDVYATGNTLEGTLPIPSTGYQSACPQNTGNTGGDACDSAYVIEINPTGSAVLGGTFFGNPALNSAATYGYIVKLDSKSQVYMMGYSNDGNLPQLDPVGSFSTNTSFLAAFSPNMGQLLFSSLLGNPAAPGNGQYGVPQNSPEGFALDPGDAMYFAATTTNGTFGTTPGTYSTGTSFGGNYHTYFGKISKVLEPTATSLVISPSTVTEDGTVSYIATVTPTLITTPTLTGTVTFIDTSTSPHTTIGTATVGTNGVAVLKQPAPGLGTQTIIASYGGDINYHPTLSAGETITVTAPTATVTFTATPTTLTQYSTVTLTATVAASSGTLTPTGTVTFLDGPNEIAQGIIVNGVVTATAEVYTTGTHVLSALYPGDSNFGAVESAPVSVTVTAVTPTASVTLTANPSTTTAGQQVALTATVAATNGTTTPIGTVTFFEGTTMLGKVTLANGIASLSTSTLPVGANSITAQYSGDTTYAAETSNAVTVTITGAAATIALSASPTTAASGSTVTFTAAVAPTTGNATPTGTVTFSDGGTVITSVTLSSTVAGVATASFADSSLSVGTHTITAYYSGDSNFSAITSSPVTVTITMAVTPTAVVTLTASSTNVTAGTTVTFTSMVSASSGTVVPTGTVTFLDNGTAIGTGIISSGVATFSSSSLAVGTNTITAQYNGNTTFAAATSSAVVVTVTPSTTPTAAISLSASPTSATQGMTVTLTAVVSVATGSGTISGTVTFLDSGTAIGMGTIVNGVATFSTSSLALGTHTITATYSGNTTFAAVTSAAVTVTVMSSATPTAAINLAATPTSLTQGATVTLTATVFVATGSGTISGTVTFFDGGTAIGSAPIVNGVATFSTAGLTLGTNTITATYNGNTTFAAVTSAAVTVTVTSSVAASAAITLAATPTSATQGATVTLAATVSVATGSGTISGTVTFFDGGTAIGGGTIANGVATFSTATLTVGTHVITATYNGNGTFGAVTSAPVTVSIAAQVVTPVAIVVLTATPVTPTPGSAVTLTATVTASSGTVAPTGTVTFLNGTTAVASATLVNGVATASTSLLGLGTQSLTASYGGDANFKVAVSAPVTVTVEVPSFTAVFNPSTLIIPQGQSGTSLLTITPMNGYNQPLSLTCSNLPNGASCTFEPANITLNGIDPVQCATKVSTSFANAKGMFPPAFGGDPKAGEIAFAMTLFGLGGLFAARRRLKLPRLLERALGVAMFGTVLLGLGLTQGCGGSPTAPSTNTPIGTSNVTVTISGGTVQQLATLTVTVQ